MYRGFTIDSSLVEAMSKLNLSEELFAQEMSSYKNALAAAIKSLDSLDAVEIQRIWFPGIKADVFLSHSRKDADLACRLGAFLKNEFNLNVFIDSLVWQHMDGMLKSLDDKYCIKTKYPKVYSYESRNVTTSHVHMILSSALTQMIDATECFIYLDSPHSTASLESASIDTFSPWLFHELTMANLLVIKKPTRQYLIKEGHAEDFAEPAEEGLRLLYSAPKDRLQPLTEDILAQWLQTYAQHPRKNSLDVLYDIMGKSCTKSQWDCFG